MEAIQLTPFQKQFMASEVDVTDLPIDKLFAQATENLGTGKAKLFNRCTVESARSVLRFVLQGVNKPACVPSGDLPQLSSGEELFGDVTIANSRMQVISKAKTGVERAIAWASFYRYIGLDKPAEELEKALVPQSVVPFFKTLFKKDIQFKTVLDLRRKAGKLSASGNIISPLHQSVLEKHPELKSFFHFIFPDYFGGTRSWKSLKNDDGKFDREKFDVLKKLKGDINCGIAHEAASIGDLEMIQELNFLQAGLNTKDDKGYTPLHLAIIGGHTDVVKALCNDKTRRQTLDRNLKTPLQLALIYRKKESVEEICFHEGIDLRTFLQKELINIFFWNKMVNTSTISKPPLQYHIESIKFLCLEMKVDINPISDCHIEKLISYICHIDLALLKALGECGVQFNSPELLRYVADKNIEALRLIAKNSKTLDIMDMYNHESFLFWLVGNGNLEGLKIFHECGANFEVLTKYSDTLLHRAASRGNADIVEFLIEKGAKVNAANGAFETPLRKAYDQRCKEILKKHGGSVVPPVITETKIKIVKGIQWLAIAIFGYKTAQHLYQYYHLDKKKTPRKQKVTHILRTTLLGSITVGALFYPHRLLWKESKGD